MSDVIEVPFIVSITIAILCLFVGIRVNRSLKALHDWGVPNIVTGGLMVAGGCWLFFTLTGTRINFNLAARDILLLYFFTGIGLNIRLSDVARGGRPLVILLGLTAALMVLQNVIAYAGASLLSLPPAMSVLLGSLALSGGHGTAIAWAPIIDARFGVHNSLEIGIAVATLGLIAGSLLGGPVAHMLISRHRLTGPAEDTPIVGLAEEVGADGANDINHFVLLRTIAIIHAAILLGYGLDAVLKWLGINMPLFVSALIMAMAIANIVPLLFPAAPMPARTRALALVSDLSLDLFLALSLMSMQLWQLAGVGLPILILFAAHVGLVVAYILVLVFPLMGRNYDAAVISSGFTGIGLGSTATAFANMSAITSIHGSSPNAFVILSLVAALFLDVANSTLVALIMRVFN